MEVGEKWRGRVALGDRKYVKLQRSAILMTLNDMPPSRCLPDRSTWGERSFCFPSLPPPPPTKSIRGSIREPSRLGPREPGRVRWTRFRESALKMQLLIGGGSNSNIKTNGGLNAKVKYRPRDVLRISPTPFIENLSRLFYLPNLFFFFSFFIHLFALFLS